MSQAVSTDVAVIGAGIIGLCVAEKLAHEGLSVMIVEAERVAAGASAGNAASFAFSEVMPMASAGTIKSAIKWLFDPTGPFSVVPQDLPETAGWLLRFALAARKKTFDQSLQTLAALMQLEQETLPKVLARTGLQQMVRQSGALYLYGSMAALRGDLGNWKLRADEGTVYEILEGQALHTLQEGLSPKIPAGVYAPNYQVVTDPKDYCVALHEAVSSNRVVTRFEKVERLEAVEGGVVLHAAHGPVARAKHVVVAAGPWSGKFAAQLGDKVSLIGERGYNTTLPKSAFPALNQPLFFTAEGFVMSPLSDGVRVGGASEVAGLERAAKFERSRMMLAKARELVPGLQDVEGVEWMGMRPTTPDTLPVVGRAARCANVIYAFGHGHLGLTLASSTAELVSDLVFERQLKIDLEALSPRRF
ncbi:MAG: FAD-binding oxidoreductase [Alphaproteobacteria bacterium]|nr:FAD-binding oxidoreductase [Alphaproteobacteria bacterium]